jgi:hypothetical protein
VKKINELFGAQWFVSPVIVLYMLLACTFDHMSRPAT